ncbi:MAG: sigma-54 dependent transcriptional regulator [Rhizomicrobium sp.]
MSPTPLNPARILVVDDEQDVLVAARLLLKRHFATVEVSCDTSRIVDAARRAEFDVLLLDMNFARSADTGAEGLDWLSKVLAVDPQAVVVLITAHGDVDLAVRAMKRGAADFVLKPWENGRLVATLTAAANLHGTRVEAAEIRDWHKGLISAFSTDSTLLGTSPGIRHVMDIIERAAPSEANVLILGENGTGKELVAREIHRRSKRRAEAFVRIDLGAIPAALFESELFGHRRGAFTGAREDRIGRFRAATGGTLFLDEIGNVPLDLQGKLLTALERREIVPVGGERAEHIDVRLVFATNQTRALLADEAKFRQDLYYRINTVEIELPPLRQRRQDIPLLVEHFLDLYCTKYNVARKRVDAATLDELTGYDWPGNVRALRHAMERAVILSDREQIAVEDFALGNSRIAGDDRRSEPLSLDAMERTAISRTLAGCGGNVSRAAQALGLTRASLYRRMEKYGL